MKQVILTGIKPTGRLHLGNYAGAMKPALELAKTAKENGDTHVLFIADYHALNTAKDPMQLKQDLKAIAATYLACGLDANDSLFYRQSDIPEIMELATILMAFTPKGYMNKAHAYKAKVDQNIASGAPQDAGINMGLYTYPVLMAADILAYGTDIVPVGKDQVQHVEMAADIAGFFNANYKGNFFKIPKAFLRENSCLLPGTDGRKMSKSYHNEIPLILKKEELKKYIMQIKTDSQELNAPKDPKTVLLFEYVQALCSDVVIQEVKEGLEKGGMGYGTIKKMLLAELETLLAPIWEKYDYYINHFNEVQILLDQGAEKARKLTVPILNQIKEVVFGGKSL